MPPFAAFALRSLAAVAVAARGSVAEARKRAPKPEAFVALTVTAVVERAAGEEPGATWKFAGAVQHPGKDFRAPFPGEVAVPAAATAKEALAIIVREARTGASFGLSLNGIVVPADRVEVIVL